MQERCPRCRARTHTPALCWICRCADRVVVTDELRQWWLDRYSFDELLELARHL